LLAVDIHDANEVILIDQCGCHVGTEAAGSASYNCASHRFLLFICTASLPV
jgi:hypothetical protein